jgi:hypothetical protein
MPRDVDAMVHGARGEGEQPRDELWDAAAKGTTFAHLVDPDRAYFECLVDINPAKQRGYVPGTGHAIVAPEALADRRVTATVLLNPKYREEVAAMLRERHLAIEVLDFGAETR